MMSDWERFPPNYRVAEVGAILEAVHSGACVALLGLSGAGKSNLLGFLAHRCSTKDYPLALVDCNRLLEQSAGGLLHLALRTLGATGPSADAFEALDQAIGIRLKRCMGLTLLFDRFDIFSAAQHFPLHNALRALRDAHKYRLAYVFATRRSLPLNSELSELVQGRTLWLGPLSEKDARWNVARFARRLGVSWNDGAVEAILRLSRGYPTLLKAACEGYAAGARLQDLANHPAVQARVAEFWADEPAQEHLAASHLDDHPLLAGRPRQLVADEELTASEQRLYDYLQAHAGRVCEKDELIRAVWPEDAVYEHGVRDSSLAQLVRRLRLKVEADASAPQFIRTVPGRGYLFRQSG